MYQMIYVQEDVATLDLSEPYINTLLLVCSQINA